MKKIIIVIMLAIANMIEACPPSTGHCVIEMGCNADIINLSRALMIHQEHDYTNIGANAFVGYESSRRWHTIGLAYKWILTGKHYIGGEYKVNVIPFWYNSPVNIHIPVSMGYVKSNIGIQDRGYFRTGLEINIGYLNSWGQFFLREDLTTEFYSEGYNINKKEFSHSLSCGFKFWIGKDW